MEHGPRERKPRGVPRLFAFVNWRGGKGHHGAKIGLCGGVGNSAGTAEPFLPTLEGVGLTLSSPKRGGGPPAGWWRGIAARGDTELFLGVTGGYGDVLRLR